MMPSKVCGIVALAQAPDSCSQDRDVEGAADDQPQHVQVDRLLVEIIGADARWRVTALSRLMVPGDHDDLGGGRQLQDLLSESGKAFR